MSETKVSNRLQNTLEIAVEPNYIETEQTWIALKSAVLSAEDKSEEDGEEEIDAVLSPLSDKALEGLQHHGEMQLGWALRDGMTEKSGWIAGALIIDDNADEIKLCHTGLILAYREGHFRKLRSEELLTKYEMAGGGVN
jgi:hypothetical protein